MRLWPLLADHLPDLEVAKLSNHPRTERQAQRQRGEAGGRRPERDVSRHVEDGEVGVQRIQQIEKHQANSAAIRSAMRSVRVPRDPLTSTRSPERNAAATAGAACSLFSK